MEEYIAKKVLIIGAGVAGMSAGCYLRMNGYDTEIFEKNAMSGGLCTAWSRKGYTFDPCTHWLVGAGPSSNFYRIWQELGVLRDTTIHNHGSFKTIALANGRTFSIQANVDMLQRQMVEIAPEDARTIRRFCNGIREAKKVVLPILKARETYSLWDYLRFPFKNWRLLRFVMRWRRLRISHFAQFFSNPELKELFLTIFTDHEDFSMIPQLLTIGWYSKQEAGRPAGGSLTVRTNLQRRYQELGGTLHLSAAVESIEIVQGRACGIVLKNGTRIKGDYVISAADMHHTLNVLLTGGQRQRFERYFRTLAPYPSFIDVNLGINGILPASIPHMVNYLAQVPIVVGNGQSRSKIVSHFFAFDESVAPAGKSVIMTHVRSHDFDFWHQLRHSDKARYEALKQSIAEQIIDIVDKKFSTPDFCIRDHIEVVDVATPDSYYRWTNNYRGSYEGWIPAPNIVGRLMKKKVPGIKNFHLIGHWVEPGGGLPAVALSGRNVAQLLCKADKKRFTTSLA